MVFNDSISTKTAPRSFSRQKPMPNQISDDAISTNTPNARGRRAAENASSKIVRTHTSTSSFETTRVLFFFFLLIFRTFRTTCAQSTSIQG